MYFETLVKNLAKYWVIILSHNTLDPRTKYIARSCQHSQEKLDHIKRINTIVFKTKNFSTKSEIHQKIQDFRLQQPTAEKN